MWEPKPILTQTGQEERYEQWCKLLLFFKGKDIYTFLKLGIFLGTWKLWSLLIIFTNSCSTLQGSLCHIFPFIMFQTVLMGHKSGLHTGQFCTHTVCCSIWLRGENINLTGQNKRKWDRVCAYACVLLWVNETMKRVSRTHQIHSTPS